MALFCVEHVIALQTFLKVFCKFQVLFNASQNINKSDYRSNANAMNLTCGFGKAKLRGEVTPRVCLKIFKKRLKPIFIRTT